MGVDFNRLTVTGYLGADPELTYTTEAVAICKFSLAVNRYAPAGEDKDPDWFRVIAWGRLAETCDQYLHKGARVLVSGECRIEEWEGRDGDARTTVEIHARGLGDVIFITTDRSQQRGDDEGEGGKPPPRRSQADQAQAARRKAQGKAPPPRQQEDIDWGVEDDEDPFGDND